MKTRTLKLLNDDGGSDVNVFVHGYNAYGNKSEYAHLLTNILRLRTKGRTYLLAWTPSTTAITLSMKDIATAFGSVVVGRRLLTAGLSATIRSIPLTPAAPVVGAAYMLCDSLMDFKKWQSHAEFAGRRLLSHVAQICKSRPRGRITLWGHSLGARVIHWSLFYGNWSKYNLDTVVLFGGATHATDSDDWERSTRHIRKKLINVYSSHDRKLTWLGGPALWENPIGLSPIEGLGSKVENHKVALGHNDYWGHLHKIARKVLPKQKTIVRSDIGSR